MIVALVAAALLLTVRIPPRIAFRRRTHESTAGDLARLLSIAAAAGMPLATALEFVSPDVGGPLGETACGVVRRARTHGLSAALLAAPELGPMAPALARAHTSGSPLTQTLEAYRVAQNAEQVAKATEAARTAPVRLMVPLALLLLPGFTALVVGPTLLDHLLDVTRLRP